jgi:hypothetical protein
VFEVVVATSDPKFGHIGRDPRVQLIVFETVPPFRGVSVRTQAEIDPDEAHVDAARLAISSRYLRPEAGARFTASRGPGVVVRMHADDAEAWDLSQALNAV